MKDVKHMVKTLYEILRVCTIATYKNNQPRASIVDYVSDGFTLYIITSDKTTKVKNILENPEGKCCYR